jgi:hypothetical protein
VLRFIALPFVRWGRGGEALRRIGLADLHVKMSEPKPTVNEWQLNSSKRFDRRLSYS